MNKPAAAAILISQLFFAGLYSLHSESDKQPAKKNSPVNQQIPQIQRLNKMKSKVVIIIDDVGAEMTHFSELTNVPGKLTVSILPGEKFSKISAEIAHQKGFEVMLHQPMQPRNIVENRIGSGGIFVSMPSLVVEKILSENISNIPYVKGVNNHMGSYATTKPPVMRAMMNVLKAKKLYFVDSLTSGSSKGYSIALEMGVKALKRDIFIDTVDGYDYAVKQLRQLKRIAKNKPVSVAIGHCRLHTINALKKILPEFEKDDIQVSKVSEVFSE